MKIAVTSNHVYPGNLYGKSAASLVHDELVKGLAELGHEVVYRVHDVKESLPEGVTFSPTLPTDAEVYHINDAPAEGYPEAAFPWVQSSHCDLRMKGIMPEYAAKNWVHVTETHARLFNTDRFVLNGFNPKDFIYNETKDDYFFFIVGGLSRSMMKGLDIALNAAEKAGVKLKIAGSRGSEQEVRAFEEMCTSRGAIPVGPVFGQQKLELYAGAKGLLFPSRYNEGCPLVVLEALFSGTPIISCNHGSMPELMDEKIGFMCKDEADYIHAIEHVDQIRSQDCLDYAIERFHYLDMAKNYVKEYQREIETFRESNSTRMVPVSGGMYE